MSIESNKHVLFKLESSFKFTSICSKLFSCFPRRPQNFKTTKCYDFTSLSMRELGSMQYQVKTKQL